MANYSGEPKSVGSPRPSLALQGIAPNVGMKMHPLFISSAKLPARLNGYDAFGFRRSIITAKAEHKTKSCSRAKTSRLI